MQVQVQGDKIRTSRPSREDLAEVDLALCRGTALPLSQVQFSAVLNVKCDAEVADAYSKPLQRLSRL